MPIPLKQEFIYLVKLALKRKKEPFTETTLWASNRSYLAGELYSGSPHVYAGLIELGGFAQRMGEVLPQASAGSIIFNNNRGTLRADKRWSDLLHYYAFYWQVAEVYLFYRYEEQVGSSSNLLLQFKGRIDDTKVSNGSNTFELGVTSNDLSRAKPHYVIDSAIIPDAPEGNFGISLPIVFGENVQVPAVKINQNGAAVSYAYATNFGSTFVNGGVQKLYIKADRDTYQEFTAASSTTTPILDFSPDATDASQEGWNTDRKAIAFRLLPGENVTAGQVIVGANWYLRFITDNPYNGTTEFQASVSIMSSKDGLPDRVIAADSIQLPLQVSKIELISAVGSVNNPYRFKFGFDTPVVIPETEPVFISFSLNGYLNNAEPPSPFFRPIVNDPSDLVDGFERYYLEQKNPDYAREVMAEADYIECFEVFGAALTDAPTGIAVNNKGFGGSSFTISRRTQDFPDLSKLEFVAEIDGLKDNSSGTITGTPNQLITSPKNAVKLLYYKQNGDSLTGLSYLRSESSVNSALATSVIKGATDSTMTYRDLIKDILFSFASKLLPSNVGGYNMWSYGVDIIEDYEISEADCIISDYATLGKGSIINSVTLNYDRRRIPLTVLETQRTNDSQNYIKSTLFENGSNAVGAIAYGSEELYDKEELSNIAENIEWFSSTADAERLAEYFLSTKTEELIIFSIALPALKYNYKDIKLGDIIRISHIDIPYEYGTAADGVEKLPSFEGQVLENFNFKEPWRRARDLLVRVVAKAPQIRMNQEEPMIQFLVEEISEKEARRP